MYHVPPELVREIFNFLFDTPLNDSEELGVPNRQKWSSIHGLTLVSKDFRALTLEAWFRTLFVTSPADITLLQDVFPEIGRAWTRELHCVQLHSRETSVWNLEGFQCLSRIRLDWMSPSMMPHYGSDDPADRLPFTHISSTVTELDIRGLPWPSPLVFHNINKILPQLRILKLRQSRTWCGLCHTCSVVKFRSPGPEMLVYEGGLGLPMHYSRVFSALEHLHTVSITVPDLGSGTTTLSQKHNPYLWSGECDRCMEIMYEDEAFRVRWVARKQGQADDTKEGGKTVYVFPPALKRVEWRFWKAESGEDSDFIENGDELNGSGDDV
ncbi:hypothetical protein Hypma_005577 [Hypsizygus marmoreus]|uniref:F-box domain-containing protein n=1 Tax=Hypsizygus marmoreus TaxID=39966 RepID=A0A369K1I9_HYPMA|nr:hypothetical protein Hypma_005577 [Hypsizygus marmoreus]